MEDVTREETIVRCPEGFHYSRLYDKCMPNEPSTTTPTTPDPIPVQSVTVIEGGLPVPVVKVSARGILGKICGEANEVVFIGFSDLFQMIVDFFIPDFWPLSALEEMFDDIFDNLQENMKPYAYNQGVAMGDRIESQVEEWIKSKFNLVMDELQKARDQALGEIAAAQRELEKQAQKLQDLLEEVAKHTPKIEDLLDRVTKLEAVSSGPLGKIGELFQ